MLPYVGYNKKKVRENWLEGRPSSSSSCSEKAWTTLWKIKVPSKILVFVWRLAQRSMPSGAVLHHRKMATSARCELCGAENDTWRHSLLNCTMARCVWALVDDSLTEHMSMTTCPEAKEWLFHMLETLPHAEFTKLIITLWAIWSARRKAIHESIFQSPEAIHGFIMRYLADLDIIADASQK